MTDKQPEWRLSNARVHEDHTPFARRDPRSLATTLLRTKSVAGREILAHLATSGRLTAKELADLPTSALDPAELVAVLDPEWTCDFARVLALQLGDEREIRQATDLYQFVTRSWGTSVLDRHAALLLQLLAIQGERDAAQRLLDDDSVDIPDHIRASVLADLLHPGDSDQDPALWLGALNEALHLSPSESISLRPDGPTLFDRITCPPEQVIDGPALITVITSAFNPDDALLTTVRSVIQQSWQNWEMLIVDDASPQRDDSVLTRAENLDPRVRVIRKAVNGGTYRARNTALSQARGTFAVVVDSGDWVHPTYLEAGVGPMLRRSGVLATRGWGVRISEELKFGRPGYDAVVACAPSLMFRIPDVPARIGLFDPVRKAADTEYAWRIEAAFGTKIHTLPRRALTLLRAGDDTLSASDFSAGWRHSSRRAYRTAYSMWHRTIEERGADPFLDPTSVRPFPVPRRWSTAIADRLTAPPHFDVVFAGDWRRHGGPQNSMLAEIDACRGAGMRVGIMHLEAMRFMTRKDDPLCAPIRELIQSGEVEWIHIDDHVDVETLILRYPPILQFPPHVSNAFTPRHLLIVANQAPAEPDGSDQRYVPSTVTEHSVDLFGVPPLWVPQGPTVRQMLLEHDAQLNISEWDSPGLIDLDSWNVRSKREFSEPVAIGRYSRDTSMKFPSTADRMLEGYGFPAEFSVRMMGAKNTVTRMMKESGYEIPENWELLRHKVKDVQDFLQDLDFFVYLDNENANEAFGRVILEAIASGVLTVTSPKHRRTFGDAAVYADPDQAVAVVQSFVDNPDRYVEHVKRAQHLVRERYSPSSFVDRLRDLDTPWIRESRAPTPDLVRFSLLATQGPLVRFAVDAPSDVAVMCTTVRTMADGRRARYLHTVYRGEYNSAVVDAAGAALAQLEVGADLAVPQADGPVLGYALVDGCRVDVAWREGLTATTRRSEGGVLAVDVALSYGPTRSTFNACVPSDDAISSNHYS
ncbi:glycosyltransferase [Ruania halotolerans]|uniref:glycosyltransferase n=1 Tax=Ruania halotolerans TaxID=2897773 RepID=UPI001E4B79CF|nr:glycosyltransferase [Ruania halotolerans]UFU07550.1 glycosyltransferase [Ruania halotolerans]